MSHESLKIVFLAMVLAIGTFATTLLTATGAHAESVGESEEPEQLNNQCMWYLTIQRCHTLAYNCACPIGGGLGEAEEDLEAGDGDAPPVPRYLPQPFGF